MKRYYFLSSLAAVLVLGPKFGQSALPKRCDLFFKKESLCAQLEWVKKPSAPKPGEILNEKHEAVFDLSFFTKKKASHPINPNKEVYVRLFMPSMGHGSSKKSVTEQKVNAQGEKIPGEWRTRQLYFTMPKDWDIHVQLMNGDDVWDEAVLHYYIDEIKDLK